MSGHVQRVGFRAATRAQALALGLRGHARNLPDGRVEVLACGPAPAVAELGRWLAHGPPGARVSGVEHVADVAGAAPGGFAVL